MSIFLAVVYYLRKLLQFADMPCNNLAQRPKKARMLTGMSQVELAKEVGISRSVLNEVEAGYRDKILRPTLLKLLTVLDKDIVCDDYYRFVLEQEEKLKLLVEKYGLRKLARMIGVDASSLEHWKRGDYQISRKYFERILEL
ncbi:helix-turn-helix transcriptional regulator [Clostridium oryzae]|nr:helix-turn-helix transcriptional regulator [Clostridium oryzae]